MSWSPHPARTAARAALALLAGLVAVVGVPDLPGRLLLGLVALGTAAGVVHDVVARPRLAARLDGVVVAGWTGRTHLPWAGLRARVRTTRHWGIATTTLELDTDPAVDPDGPLVVLGRRDLGVPVEEVARDLRALDPTRGRPV